MDQKEKTPIKDNLFSKI